MNNEKKKLDLEFEKRKKIIEEKYQEANEALDQFLEKYGERLSAYHDAIHRVSQWYENKVHNLEELQIDERTKRKYNNYSLLGQLIEPAGSDIHNMLNLLETITSSTSVSYTKALSILRGEKIAKLLENKHTHELLVNDVLLEEALTLEFLKEHIQTHYNIITKKES